MDSNASSHSSQQEKKQAYQQAAEWYLLMQEQPLTDQQQEEFEAWQQIPLHQQVWQNVRMFDDKFQRLPKQQIARTVQHFDATLPKWAAQLCIVLCSALGLLYVGQGVRQQDYFPEIWSFDPVEIYHTERGMQQHLTLQDGSQVWLNSNSKIRVKYNSQQRRIELAKGEIYIETHKDTFKRQLSVRTSHGDLLALGTVFNVRYSAEKTELLVRQGIVRILTKDRQTQQDIPAQHAATFNQDKISPKSYQATHMLWRQQLLVVHSMPLGQFIKELTPHYQGKIQLEPALGEILISGSYSTQDVEKTLSIVTNTHHLNIQVKPQKIQLAQ